MVSIYYLYPYQKNEWPQAKDKCVWYSKPETSHKNYAKESLMGMKCSIPY